MSTRRYQNALKPILNNDTAIDIYKHAAQLVSLYAKTAEVLSGKVIFAIRTKKT